MKKITKALYAELLERTELKKATAIKYADPCTLETMAHKAMASKASRYLYENDEEKGVLKRTIVANTYNWLDSHGDVHLAGLFAKSIAERGGKSPHLHDHIFQLDARVGKPLKFYEKEISWRELGASKTGMTQALFMESEIRKSYNEKVYEDYLNDDIDQHSVFMRYDKIELAVNDEEDYPKEYAVWQKYIGLLGNRPKAEEQGFFWAVSEAQLMEVSAVLLGSNELTPTLGGGKGLPHKVVNEEQVPDTRLLDAIKAMSEAI